MMHIKGSLLLTFWLLAIPFACAQNITDFKKVTPSVQYKKQGEMNYCLLQHGELGVQVVMDETNCDYTCWAAMRFTQNGRPVGEWFSLGKSVPESELLFYYSESAKAYYIIDDVEADDAEMFDLYYVTYNSSVFEGMFYPKDEQAEDYYSTTPEHIIHISRIADNPQFTFTYGENKTLGFKKYEPENDEETLGNGQDEKLNKKAAAFNWQKGFTPTLKYSKTFDLMDDGEPEKFEIDWAKKEITYGNTDAMMLIKDGKAKDYIRFSGDTLMVSIKNNKPKQPGTYTYYFALSKKYNTALTAKYRYANTAKGCTIKEDFFPIYEGLIYTLEGFTLTGEYTFCHSCFGRRFTPKSLYSRLIKKDTSSSFYNQCVPPPGYLEIEMLLEKNPITTDNVQVYNDIAYYMVDFMPEDTNNRRQVTETCIHLLGQITYKFPDRAVAWLNLADVYWTRNDNYKSQAKEAYKKYLGLMKAQGKEAKIPQRVHERIK